MIVVLDNLRSAYNVGSIFRTCDALGITEIYCCGITPSQGNIKVKKTALGAEEHLNVHDAESTYETVMNLKKKGQEIIALELTNDATQVTAGLGDAVLVVGNEVSGVDGDILKLCDQKVMIPMQGVKESLNVSVAFGIAAYTMLLKKT